MATCPSCGQENRSEHQFCVGCGTRFRQKTAAAGIERYRLEGVLGRGASSIVYRATDLESGRSAAVKALNPELVHRPELRQRLQDEARVLAELSHPNIVGVVEYIEADSLAWLVTESINGASLRNVLIQARQLDPEQALSIFTGMLAGLAYAHERGLVHGDLKPENVIVESSGTAKLVDFGQAVPAGQATTGGTASYMSPEAVRGEAVTPASDLYSIGAVLYEALTGRPPFLAASEEGLLQAQLTEAAAPISELPDAIAALVFSMLEKDPDRRPSSASAALSSLEAAVRDAYGSEWRRRAGVAALVETTATRFPTLTTSETSTVAAQPGTDGEAPAAKPSEEATTARIPTAVPFSDRTGPVKRRPRRTLVVSLVTIVLLAGLVVGPASPQEAPPCSGPH